ncbi:asparagine synthase (glutamine-hydrolyzing) [bacterium]|nr:asparagine synthase (glutamine-hydrolyzing) [bacterium]
MCGICGVVDYNLRNKPDQNLLDKATDLMKHRGPDGRGTWSEPGVGIGHRRLAIIDLEGSPQPMMSKDKRYVLSYNGEVYNYRQLRIILEGEGANFRTKGDTEVVLQALIHWGVNAVNRFEGMFAFSLWDRKEQSLLLVRDRLGIKPLFYSEKNNKFIFASEFKPILIYPWISSQPDPLGVTSYLANYQISFDSQSIFKDIKSLKPGTYLKYTSDGIETKQYWKLPFIPSKEKKAIWTPDRFPEAVSQLSSMMPEVVKSHLISDVPVGSFLSGGIDSSVIITLMSDISGEKVKAYSVGFAEKGFSEFEFSQPLVEHLGLDHQLLKLSQKDYFPLMEKLIRHKAAPLSTPNEVPLWKLSKHLSKDIKVVLSGEGADELLGGYPSLLRSPHDFLASKKLREKADLMPQSTRQAIRDAIRRQYGKIGFKDLPDHFLNIYSWLNETDRREVLNPDFSNTLIETQIQQFWTGKIRKLPGLSPYDRYLYILETEHLRGLLARLDADTMAASVEGRVPYCDSRLVEYVWQLPFEYKLHWKSEKHRRMSGGLNSLEIAEKLDTAKYLLKETFRNRIPESIINRQKKAFPVPLESWLTGDYKNIVVDRITSSLKIADFLNASGLESWITRTLSTGIGAMKVWMLLNLVIWLEEIDNL